MKILSVNKFYYIHGGSDRYFFELNELHRQAGHEVIPFAMKHPQNIHSDYEPYFLSQVNYWDSPSWDEKVKAATRMLYSREAKDHIRRVIEDTKPDIAHLHLIYHQISPAIMPVIKNYNLPIVQTLHDYKPICPTYSLFAHGKICERCKGKRFYQATLQRCNHGALLSSFLNSVEMYLHHVWGWYDMPDVCITPSDFMRRKMVEFGMSPNKFHHIPNFVDPDKYSESFGWGDYFVYVGRLVPFKGVKTLLLAMQQIKKNVHLLIIGDGPQRPDLEILKADLGLTNVTFLGYRSADDLMDILSKAMFSVLPSEWYENCPMSVLESMAKGKPAIGANIGGIPELISHDEDGLLFESGNVDDLAQKINSLLANPQLCQEMGRMAREKIVTHYSPEVHYRKLMKVYENLL